MNHVVLCLISIALVFEADLIATHDLSTIQKILIGLSFALNLHVLKRVL